MPLGGTTFIDEQRVSVMLPFLVVLDLQMELPRSGCPVGLFIEKVEWPLFARFTLACHRNVLTRL